MEFLQDIQPLTILLILAGLAVGWILLRVALRLTIKVFACGCLGLLALGAGLYLVSTLLG